MKVLVLVTALCCVKVLAQDSPFVQHGLVAGGGDGVIGKALSVTCVAVVGLYLGWNCLQFLNHVRSERVLRATALRLCRCAPDHVARNTLHALFRCEEQEDTAGNTGPLPLYFGRDKHPQLPQ